ncbi:hypothetical protein COCSUDRAFT_32533 [Coccomyxa subellipsoidea C-169]|uniref:Uncharacterized protein n=1 Tax=Coccomyxa subellipsoidea (strain C-169) TaxID=574566 RepID=I0Z2X8_COCSC|nr:hypothetical protein COCSUDRAFT_32533 [Coccomyxa subellipsoidea C-169]EIE24997.1 hypothetical protein COCSUDRAFT_32533 [Coccomyxa subellipsoidea C-169]|eukprot:XP_005649541.1 hypothetical protein COCSUDRAFT_32533 [Coccomyxa subellipsoidea C-169]
MKSFQFVMQDACFAPDPTAIWQVPYCWFLAQSACTEIPNQAPLKSRFLDSMHSTHTAPNLPMFARLHDTLVPGGSLKIQEYN